MSLERKPIEEKSVNIEQTLLMQKMEHFLANVSKKEKLGNESGVCNGLVAMLMRARRLGQKEKFFQRLRYISTRTDDELAQLGQTLRTYKKNYNRYLKKNPLTTKINSLETERTEQRSLLTKNKKQLTSNINQLSREEIQRLELTNQNYQKKIDELNQKITSIRKKREEDILLKLQKEINVKQFNQAKDLYDFIHSLLLTHNPAITKLKKNANDSAIVGQLDFNHTFLLLSDDKDEKELIPKMVNQIFLNFSEAELIKAINELVLEGDDVLLDSSTHVTHLTKSNGKYIWYNSNHPKGEQIFSSSQELIKTMKESFCKDLRNNESFLGEMIIFSSSNAPRKDALVTLEEILAKREKNTINEQNIASKSSPLLLAVSAQNLSISKKFLSLGADPNVKNRNNYDPLRKACLKQNSALATLLLSYGSDPNAIGKDNKSSLYITLYNIKVKVDNVIIKVNPDYFTVSETLLKNGANPNFIDEQGNSILHIAIENKNEDLIFLLLKYGANPEIKNAEGISAFKMMLDLNIGPKSIHPSFKDYISKMADFRKTEQDDIISLKISHNLSNVANSINKLQNIDIEIYALTQSIDQQINELKKSAKNMQQDFKNKLLETKLDIIMKYRAYTITSQYKENLKNVLTEEEKNIAKEEYNTKKVSLEQKYTEFKEALKLEYTAFEKSSSDPTLITTKITEEFTKLTTLFEKLTSEKDDKKESNNALNKLKELFEPLELLKKEKTTQESSLDQQYHDLLKQKEINETNMQLKKDRILPDARDLMLETQKLLASIDMKTVDTAKKQQLCDSLSAELKKEKPDFTKIKKLLPDQSALQQERVEILASLANTREKRTSVVEQYKIIMKAKPEAALNKFGVFKQKPPENFRPQAPANDAVISPPVKKISSRR